MHNSYVNGEEHCPMTLAAALNVLVDWKGDNIPPSQQYESIKRVALTTKGNIGRFRGDCYNCGNSSHMAWYCHELMKE